MHSEEQISCSLSWGTPVLYADNLDILRWHDQELKDQSDL